MGNRTILGLIILAASIFSTSSYAACVVGQTIKTIGNADKNIPVIASACVPQGQDPSVYCKSKGSAFFGIPGGGFACNNTYPGGYKEICEKEFGMVVNHTIGSTAHGSSYRTVSQADLDNCIKGRPFDRPACDPKQGEWKSFGGRDSYMTCVCSDGDSVSVSESECGSKKGVTCNNETQVLNADKTACECKSGYEGPNCEKRKEVANTTTPSVAPENVSQELINCTAPFEKEAQTCAFTAAEAKKTCDQTNKENQEVAKSYGQTAQIPGQIASQYINAKSCANPNLSAADKLRCAQSESSVVASCIQAGAVSGGSKILMESMKKTCDANFDECTKSCGEEKAQQYLATCGKVGTQVSRGGDLQDDPDFKYRKQKYEEILAAQKQGTPLCKQDAAANRNMLSALMNDLGQALLAGQRCACQMSANTLGTSTSTCNSLPTAEQCTANPSLAGCPSVLAIDICTQGSANYNALGCQCQTNSKAEGCPGYVASAGNLSGFAGADIGSGSSGSGGAAFGAGNSGGGLNAGDLDISGAHASDLASGNKAGALTGFGGGGAGGGGAGGLGAVPGGGPEGVANAAGEGDGKEGLGGAFGMAKSIMGSLFGGGSGANSKTGTASKTNPNMNKFRPNGLRGVANSSDFAEKNGDIWNRLHNFYDDTQTSFFTGP